MKNKTKQPKKLKTYTVPVVHHVSFGMEIEVQASNLREAREKALRFDADTGGDGYDWDRMELEKTRIGQWQKIAISEGEPS